VTIAFRPGESEPKLIRIAGPPTLKLGISNSRAEELPSSVAVNGNTVPLHWQLKSSTRRDPGKDITFTYESDTPHLRLSWEWQARADFGPIEHRITIQNLEVFDVLADENVLLVRGNVPGGKNGYVLVQKSVKKAVYKRKRGEVIEEKSKNPMKASKAGAATKK